LIGHNLSGLSPDPILILVGADLQTPFHGHKAAFGQVIGTDLRLLPPSHDVDEIRFPLTALTNEGAIDRKREIGYRYPRLSVTQLWVRYQSPDKNYPV
jgi:hypothetical protein